MDYMLLIKSDSRNNPPTFPTKPPLIPKTHPSRKGGCMPTSKKQIKANKLNAQKSTGPKTAEGKAIVATNALTHGLCSSDDIVIRSVRMSEDKNEFEGLFKSLMDELKPVTAFQYHQVQKIATCLWRSRRLLMAETAQINDRLNCTSPNHFSDTYDDESGNASIPDELTNIVNARSILSAISSGHLLIYEMRLDRQLTRAYALLQNLQLDAVMNLTPPWNPKKPK